MKIKAVAHSKKNVIMLTILFLSSLLILCLRIYSEKQNSIDITPENVLIAFRDSGYQATNIEKNVRENIYPLGDVKDGLRFEIIEDDDIYGVILVSYNSWFDALRISKKINNLDRKWNGDYGCSFHYGTILVSIWPSDQEFIVELIAVLEQTE